MQPIENMMRSRGETARARRRLTHSVVSISVPLRSLVCSAVPLGSPAFYPSGQTAGFVQHTALELRDHFQKSLGRGSLRS